ncbi:MAG: dTMP kinase [Gammaproteobacteria bacterium]|nr:dTMP kinase [Gammaproteobacteria bacterium]MCY4211331.1 dTMP kinase [Gammaproteobacteria bacterium]MCY4282075.1 dTMP kinase [Gammaproteobacteria bacterium]MCY4337515.1 dTMP kinase [Gammaproteobacteria bacterium]
MKGLLITFEGIEGVGKTTQVQRAFDLLEAEHPGRVVVTREPGGTRAGEAIREIMLQSGAAYIDGMTEMLLVFAARRQHLRELIEPALQAGKIVLCDRFTDATFAYQGGGRGVPEQHIERLQDMVQDGLRPHLTLLFDAPVETGLARLRARKDLDRMETEAVNFFRQVRAKYLELAARHPDRIHVIDANADIETVSAAVRTILAGHKLC